MTDDGGIRVARTWGFAGAHAYADAVDHLRLALRSLTSVADYWSAFCSGHNSKLLNVRNLPSARQAIPMVWDFAEANPFSSVRRGTGLGQVDKLGFRSVAAFRIGWGPVGEVLQRDATARMADDITSPVVCTDPPYYDNISYAELSDFFYVWLAQQPGDVWPEETATLLTPKSEEMIANPYRAGSKEAAKAHFRGREWH